MQGHLVTNRISLILIVLLILYVTIAFSDSETSDNDIKTDLSKEQIQKLIPDFPDGIKMENPNETQTFPPRPVEFKKTYEINYTIDGNILTDKEVNSLREFAESQDLIQEALGKKYTYISSGRAGVKKEEEKNQKNLKTIITYYSYVKNRAFDVYISDKEIIEIIGFNEGYQPPTNFEEIASARRIVIENESKQNLDNLMSRGIVLEAENTDRHLYLSFHETDGRNVFSAVVNMTASKVVRFGKTPRD